MAHIRTNMMRTEVTCKKCKQAIISYHVYDYKRCKCGAVGVDGGGEYSRIMGHKRSMTLRTVRVVFKNTGKHDPVQEALEEEKRIKEAMESFHNLPLARIRPRKGKN
jgi:hypothetical protein